MAATHYQCCSLGGIRDRQSWQGGEMKEMELDRECPKEKSKRRLCCSTWMKTREMKKRGHPKTMWEKWWRQKGTELAGAHGAWRDTRLQTDNSGSVLSDIERIKVRLCAKIKLPTIRHYSHSNLPKARIHPNDNNRNRISVTNANMQRHSNFFVIVFYSFQLLE